MKPFYYILLLILLSIELKAQDVIYLKNNDSINCKILKVDLSSIDYLEQKDKTVQDSTVITISSDKIRTYKYGKRNYMPDVESSSNINSEQNKNPDYNINIGIGFNYFNRSQFVLKGLIGLNNSGIIFSGGFLNGKLLKSIGLQFSYDIYFINISYSAYDLNNYDDVSLKKDILYGACFFGGGMINLTKNKRLFLDFGLGYIIGQVHKYESTYITSVYPQVSTSTFKHSVSDNFTVLCWGINYRF